MKTILLALALSSIATAQLTIDCPKELPRDSLVMLKVGGIPEKFVATVEVISKKRFEAVNAYKLELSDTWAMAGAPDRYLVRVLAFGEGRILTLAHSFEILPSVDPNPDPPDPDPDPFPPNPEPDDDDEFVDLTIKGAAKAIAKRIGRDKSSKLADLWRKASLAITTGRATYRSTIKSLNEKTVAIVGQQEFSKMSKELRPYFDKVYQANGNAMPPLIVGPLFFQGSEGFK